MFVKNQKIEHKTLGKGVVLNIIDRKEHYQEKFLDYPDLIEVHFENDYFSKNRLFTEESLMNQLVEVK